MQLCQCGCGQAAPRAISSRPERGYHKGDVLRFVNGHGTRKHGLTGTPEYWAWWGMLQRCNNPQNKHYADYGGRGISVCPRWKDFAHFFADMGTKPTDLHTLDRRDNEQGYNEVNCKWATRKEQIDNRRCTRKFLVKGTTKLLTDLVAESGLSYSVVSRRLAIGWSVEDALRTPVGVKRAVHV